MVQQPTKIKPMHQLTNSERARVFAMYLGCEVYDSYNDKTGKLIGVDFKRGLEVKHEIEWSLTQFECKLLLTPLDLISEEDFKVMAGLCGVEGRLYRTENKVSIKDSRCEEWVILKDGEFEHYESIQLEESRQDVYHSLSSSAFQYLISRGYSVPIFFAPGHPNNELTPIQMGVGINKSLK